MSLAHTTLSRLLIQSLFCL